jgi:hypothetical protein
MGILKADTGFKINYTNAFHCMASCNRAFEIKISIMGICCVEKNRLFFQKNLYFLGIGGEHESIYIDIFIGFQAAFF